MECIGEANEVISYANSTSKKAEEPFPTEGRRGQDLTINSASLMSRKNFMSYLIVLSIFVFVIIVMIMIISVRHYSRLLPLYHQMLERKR